MTDRSMEELWEIAAEAAREIEQTWPEWKKELTRPREIVLRPASQSTRKDQRDWHD